MKVVWGESAGAGKGGGNVKIGAVHVIDASNAGKAASAGVGDGRANSFLAEKLFPGVGLPPCFFVGVLEGCVSLGGNCQAHDDDAIAVASK